MRAGLFANLHKEQIKCRHVNCGIHFFLTSLGLATSVENQQVREKTCRSGFPAAHLSDRAHWDATHADPCLACSTTTHPAATIGTTHNNYQQHS